MKSLLQSTITVGVALGLASFANAQLSVSMAARETGFAGGSFTNIGDDGGFSGGIEWINRDNQTLILDGSWQLFTFDLANDPITAFAGGSADGVLDGDFGTLEHIRFLNSGAQTGPFTIWIDDVTNTVGGVPTTFGTFDSFTAGDEVMFQEPSFFGSTGGNIAAGSTSGVDDTSCSISAPGTARVDWSFNAGTATEWLRLTTFNATNQRNPLIRFDQGSRVSLWMRGVAPATAPCEEFNPGPTGSTSPTPSPFVGNEPAYRAYQFTASANQVVEAAAAFTRKWGNPKEFGIEIWGDAGGSPDPYAVLGSTTIYSAGGGGSGAVSSWLGGNLNQPVPLTMGTDYWIVFVYFAGWNVPEDPAGTTLMPLALSNGGTFPTFNLVRPAPGKFRLFCNPLQVGGVTSFGSGCANSNGSIGAMFTNTAPTAGNLDFAFEASGLPGGEMTWLLLGFNPTFPSVPLDTSIGAPAGCALHVSGDFTLLGPTSGTVAIGAPGDPFGYARFPLALSNTNPCLTFTAQVFAIDSGSTAPITLVNTNALRITTQ